MHAEDEDDADRVERILSSPAFRRADEDLELLAQPALRAVRLQLEFMKPELTFERRGIERTIVVFGGARVRPPERARAALERLDPTTADADERRRAERAVANSRYYEVAREFGRIVAEAGTCPTCERLMLVTGGGPGLMEAVNRGAADAGEASIGLGILLPHEQRPNAYLDPELAFQFRYFALRKLHFMLRARALVAFPGGFGTFDEVFETLCLLQTGKHEPMPVVLVGRAFWERAVDFDFLVEEGMVSQADVELFSIVETAEEAWRCILDWHARHGRPLLG